MNPELFNYYITPVYVTATNMVTPITNIQFNSLYTNVLEFVVFIWQTVTIFVYTFAFVAKESINAIDNNLSNTEKILLALCLYNFIAHIISDVDLIEKQFKLQEKLESTEKQINYLRSTERTHDNREQMWVQEIRNMHNENDKKFKDIEKNLNIQKKFVDAKTKNEKEIIKNVSELSKEIKRIKKELNKYD